MKHSEKIKLARKMLTPKERKGNTRTSRKTPLFDSKAWNERKKAIAERVISKKLKSNLK